MDYANYLEKSEVHPYSVISRQVDVSDFDQIISRFAGVVQEMTVAFALSRWAKIKIEPWIFEQGNKPVAAALVMLQPYPLGLGHLAVIKWGPILADEVCEDRSQIYEATIAFLQNEYAVRRKLMLSIMPRAEQDPPLHAQNILGTKGFKAGPALGFPNRYLINVKLSDVEQRKSFSQKWRYHLNKSEKENLEFEIAPASDLPRFKKLYAAMSDRKQFPDFSAFETLENIFTDLPSSITPALFFITKNGGDVAGAVIFTGGRTAVYLYGATNDQALPLRAGYLMHARIIAWLRDNTKAEWYDLGGTDGFQGLHQFKKGMVGTAGRITPVPPIQNFASSPVAKLLGNTAYTARDMAQKARRKLNALCSKVPKTDQESDS